MRRTEIAFATLRALAVETNGILNKQLFTIQKGFRNENLKSVPMVTRRDFDANPCEAIP